MQLILVRHTSVDVPPGTCYGQSDVDVADTFVDEASRVRERLRGIECDHVYSSPLKRCLKLASACGYDMPQIDRRLMEISFGQWEMRRWDDIDDPRLQEYYSDYEHVGATGGESFADQRRRVCACLDDIARQAGKDARVLVFTHGGVIVAAMMSSLGMDAAEAFRHQPQYGDVVVIDWPIEAIWRQR